MASFKNLVDLRKHLENEFTESMYRSAEIERFLGEVVSQAVHDVVYSAYSPEQYERRGDDGGLSDERNYSIVDYGVKNGKAFITFENLTTGSDSLSTVYLTDTIEEGIKENWDNPNGPWSEKRPFMEEAANRIKENPSELKNIIKKSLMGRGFKFK